MCSEIYLPTYQHEDSLKNKIIISKYSLSLSVLMLVQHFEN